MFEDFQKCFLTLHKSLLSGVCFGCLFYILKVGSYRKRDKVKQMPYKSCYRTQDWLFNFNDSESESDSDHKNCEENTELFFESNGNMFLMIQFCIGCKIALLRLMRCDFNML